MSVAAEQLEGAEKPGLGEFRLISVMQSLIYMHRGPVVEILVGYQ